LGLLNGKTVLVTGAGQGIGAALAQGIAREGARVVVTDIDAHASAQTVAAILATGGQALARTLDVTDSPAVRALAAELGSQVGPIDVLVNNAGIGIDARIDSAEAEESWRRTLAVNLDGVFNVTYAFVPALKQSRGNIVNIASITAFISSRTSFAYGVSKGAIRSLTQSLCYELGPHGIRVNAIAPGVTQTPMVESELAALGARHWFAARAPLGRVAQSHEMVGPVVFLASEMASFVTGTVLPIDGGFLCT
jgi:NAD(P)-dependent dehydrogenase (short-subunit alcohol dehydrogenase family)